jgi:uncharacterized protein (TIGR02217 family)
MSVMAYDNVKFPTAIARGSRGGPERRTDVVATASGREERNARWFQSRRRYNVGTGIKSINDIHTVTAFFEERRGRLHSFRFKDHADFKSCPPQSTVTATDQLIGTGDSSTAVFQLTKSYGTGLRNYARVIAAPVAGTVLISVNSVPTTQFTLNAATGEVTFNPGSIPASAAEVRAGFEFDTIVRFDTDTLSIDLEGFTGGTVPDISLIEVLP